MAQGPWDIVHVRMDSGKTGFWNERDIVSHDMEDPGGTTGAALTRERCPHCDVERECLIPPELIGDREYLPRIRYVPADRASDQHVAPRHGEPTRHGS